MRIYANTIWHVDQVNLKAKIVYEKINLSHICLSAIGRWARSVCGIGVKVAFCLVCILMLITFTQEIIGICSFGVGYYMKTLVFWYARLLANIFIKFSSVPGI